MDIWAWVEDSKDELRKAGNARLADLMDRLPSLSSDDRFEEASATVNEALALARSANLPWLEVFIRHWRLQALVVGGYRVKDWLTESVSLLEFANRKETSGCPQSVCVTQDLAICYSRRDDEGFVDERLAIAKETLDRIDARWPCFECISNEYASALYDKGDYQQSLDFVEQQRVAMIKAGQTVDAHFAPSRRDSLVALGRLSEALELVVTAQKTPHQKGESYDLSLEVSKAWVLVKMGRADEAGQSLPDYSRVAAHPSVYHHWADAVLGLCQASAYANTWQLHAQLLSLRNRLMNYGALGDAVRLGVIAAEIALMRAAPQTAERVLGGARELATELRKPKKVLATIEELERRVGAVAAPVVDLPESPEAVVAALGDDPEKSLNTLEQARHRWPDSVILLRQYAHSLRLLGEPKAALREIAQAGHHDADTFHLKLELLLEAADYEAFEREAGEGLRSSDSSIVVRAHWILANRRRREGNNKSAREHLEKVLALEPSAKNTRILLATILQEQGDYAGSLPYLNSLIDEGAEPGSVDWLRMMAATVLGRWDLVRRSAKRVGIECEENNEPMTDGGGLCRLRFDGVGEESPQVLFAVRTSPVGARVIEQSEPSFTSHYADEVVFDAAPLNEAPKEGEEENHTWLYPVVHLLKAGGYKTFALDGVHPGEEALEKLSAALDTLGAKLHVRSGDTYQVASPNDETLPGIYAFVAVPSSLELARVHALLLEHTSGWSHPILWPTLARMAGATDEAERQSSVAQEYCLDESTM